MAHPVTPPGWQRAGFTGPDCVAFGPPRRSGRLEGRDAGWRDAGYTSSACETFSQPGQG